MQEDAMWQLQSPKHHLVHPLKTLVEGRASLAGALESMRGPVAPEIVWWKLEHGVLTAFSCTSGFDRRFIDDYLSWIVRNDPFVLRLAARPEQGVLTNLIINPHNERHRKHLDI